MSLQNCLARGLAAAALVRCGFAPTFTLSGGAADANAFNEKGLRCLNLANGMAEIHTPDEHIAVADLEAMGVLEKIQHGIDEGSQTEIDVHPLGNSSEVARVQVADVLLGEAKVLKLAANLPRLGRLAAPDASVEKVSKLCGSRVLVDVTVEDVIY